MPKMLRLFSALALTFLLGGTGLAAAQEKAAEKAAPAAASPATATYRELILGNAKAKVTVVEFASLTCSHCARFAQTVYPEIKKNYIDTGKIRFVFKDFPLDDLA